MGLTPAQELEAIRRELEGRGKELTPALVHADTIAEEMTNDNLHGVTDYTEYRDKPVEFCSEILKVHLWSKQREIIEATRDYPKVSVRSSHGVGKTYLAGCITTWFLYTHPNSIVLTTAPAGRTVAEQLWREIRSRVAHAGLPGRCLTTKIELAEKWFAMGFSTDDASKFQGYHAADILLIVDEAGGVEQQIYDAADGVLTTTGSRQLLIGNPTTTSGKFYDSHHKMRGYWHPIHINCAMSPNYTKEDVPKVVEDNLVSAVWAEERKAEWGEDSPLYKVRVLGEFCDLDEAALIALSWLEQASTWSPEAAGPVVLGLDVARQGACETALYIRQGDRILHFASWRGHDLAQTAGRVMYLGRQYGVKQYNIDATGMGAGVIDIMKGVQGINEIHVGSSATDKAKFELLRDELWWALRERLRTGAIGPLDDEITKSQLSTIRYTYTKRGKICVEDKRTLMERKLPSPDRADALTLAFADCGAVKKSRRAWAW